MTVFYAVPSFCKGFPQVFEVRVVFGNVHQVFFVLFFGLSAKRLFLSCSRASLKYWSISWILYPLSISLVLKLARADFKLSGSELVRILEMTVPFMNPRKTESGWHDVRWRY